MPARSAGAAVRTVRGTCTYARTATHATGEGHTRACGEGKIHHTRAFVVTNTDDCRESGVLVHWTPWPSLCDGIPRLLYREFGGEFGTVVW